MNTCETLTDNCDSNRPPVDFHLVEEIFDGLELVIRDISRFLNDYCDRMQRVKPEGTLEQNPAPDAEALTEEHVHWEAKRAEVERSIREQVDLLADAWLRVEAEQRSLLQRKEGLASRSDKTSTGPSPQSGPKPVPVVYDSSPGPQHNAFSEFERLRAEIQSSRPYIDVQKD